MQSLLERLQFWFLTYTDPPASIFPEGIRTGFIFALGVDVHKRMLAIVIAEVVVEGDYEFERCQVGTSLGELRKLAEWLGGRKIFRMANV